MTNALDNFYHTQPEPTRGCLLALREIILSCHPDITPEWKYKLPFFYYKGKMLCYLWRDKVTMEPYLGFMKGKELNHPNLISGTRKMVRIFPVEANKDIDVDTITNLVTQSIDLIQIE